jgi:hypothetical protein
MQSISLQCPSCGRHNEDIDEQCECGFINDKSVIAELGTKDIDAIKSKSLKKIADQRNDRSTSQSVIKEIDSWIFTFSQEENCINLGTPALKEFKLKVTLEDLEELLECVYKLTGSQKTIRKIQMSIDALPDLIEEINNLIEEKRAKIPIKFNKAELQEIAESINKKLEE